MFEMIPQWAQNQASQREQQNPTMAGGGTNLAGIFGGGQAPQDTGGMMGAIGATQSQPTPQEAYGPGPNSIANQASGQYMANRFRLGGNVGVKSPEDAIQRAQTAYQATPMGQAYDAANGLLRYGADGSLTNNPMASDPVAARAMLGLGPDGTPIGAGGAQSGGTNLASILGQQQQPSSGMSGAMGGVIPISGKANQISIPQSAIGQGSFGDTPGMLAARAATGTRGGSGPSLGLGSLAFGLGGGSKNNSPIQDISQAIALGRPITDAQWAKAGYGPGGSGGPQASGGGGGGSGPDLGTLLTLASIAAHFV